MRAIGIIGLVVFQFFVSCKNSSAIAQEDIEVGYQDVVKEEEEETKEEIIEDEEQTNFSLEKNIGEIKYATLVQADSVKISKIVEVEVEKGSGEFGRTTEFLKKINSKESDFFQKVNDNRNYIQDKTAEVEDFNPSLQFELKHEKDWIFVMLDVQSNKLGFIDVRGQEVFTIRENLKTELLELANN